MRYTTPVPNEVFDMYLRDLKPGELKVLLVVVRQTLGFMIGPNHEFRRSRVWLSRRRIQQLTGLSLRGVTTSIKGLLAKHLIVITNEMKERIHTSHGRSQAEKLYFSLSIRYPHTCEKWCKKVTRQCIFGNSPSYLFDLTQGKKVTLYKTIDKKKR